MTPLFADLRRSVALLCLCLAAVWAFDSARAQTAPAPAPANLGGESLLFFNGDILQGQLLHVARDQPLRWKHPDAPQPIEFQTRNIAEVRLQTSQPARTTNTADHVSVRLTNQDMLTGQLVALDDKSLQLVTEYAGPLTIRRAMLIGLFPQAATSGTRYSGPNSLAEWTGSRGGSAWRFRNNSLYAYSNGVITREMNLADMVRIDFDMAWRRYINFAVVLYCNPTQINRPSPSYWLQFSGNQLSLQRLTANQGPILVGPQVNVPGLVQKNSARVTILINRPEKSASVLLDDTFIQQWTDADDFAQSGTGLAFNNFSDGQIRISNIRITHWDGRVPQPTPAGQTQGDTIVLINQDKVTGKLQSIGNRQITFATAYATLTIPLERADQIIFGSTTSEQARRLPLDITCTLANSDIITMALEKLDANTVTGASENFGPISVQRRAIHHIRFQIYDERHRASRKDEDDF